MTAIAYGTDANYLPLVCFSIRSMCEHTEAPPDLFVVTADTPDEELARADAYVRRLPVRVHFRPAPAFKSGRVGRHMTRAAYLRLCLGQVVPAEHRRVLYLDADTRVADDLAPLLATDLGGRTAAAAHDLLALSQLTIHQVRRDCGLRDDQSYFNSGVMLIDMDRWREREIGARAADFCESHPGRCLYFDQCALNRVLADDWTPFDQHWNYFAILPDVGASYGRLQRATGPAGIYHYVAEHKPWRNVTLPCLVEHNRWYVEAARHSPWPDVATAPSPARLARIHAKRLLRSCRYGLRRQVSIVAPGLLSERTRRRLRRQRLLDDALASNDPKPLMAGLRAA